MRLSKSIIMAFMLVSTASVMFAERTLKTVDDAQVDGIKLVLERHEMRKMDVPLSTEIKDDVIISRYEDNSITTNAVRIMSMRPAVREQVVSLLEDQEILEAARQLALRVRVNKPELEEFNDADIISVADEVLSGSHNTAVSSVIGAVLGAAAASLISKKVKKDETIIQNI